MYSFPIRNPNGASAVADHEKSKWEFIDKHQAWASAALQDRKFDVRTQGPELMRRIALDLNLRSAWNYVAAYGGQAPGPDGLRCRDLESSEVWDYLRAIGSQLASRQYSPGPDRLVKIEKGLGRGTRTLRLQNIIDRVVQRAIVQIIQPFLDPRFDPRSFGFRPQLDRRHALATALHLTNHNKTQVWLTEDLKDAFDQVPHGRLLDVLGVRLPAEVVRFIEVVIANPEHRGLRQGGSLSPLLLNLYLDHFLDRPWRKRHPATPLLRYADDLLVLCSTHQEARVARQGLQQFGLAAGMRLKGNEETAIHDLHAGGAPEWLGFQVMERGQKLSVEIGERAWFRLGEKLNLAHEKPFPPLVARAVVEAWLRQQGPCRRQETAGDVCERVREVAAQAGFDEIPGPAELIRILGQAYGRWKRLRTKVLSGLRGELQVA